MTGHECQSNWNCVEVDIVGNESTNLSSNLGIHCSGNCLCAHPNELFEQGTSISHISAFLLFFLPSLSSFIFTTSTLVPNFILLI